jgi:alginate O-acetyltransferase complex protein AlgI
MLFNSYEFILVFLPITATVFGLLSSFLRGNLAFVWILIASIFFYSAWGISHLYILLISTLVNWAFAELIVRLKDKNPDPIELTKPTKLVFAISVGFNIILLGYFKYTNFLIDIFNVVGLDLKHIENISLPLGISFYTFEQISYLTRILKSNSKNYSYPQFLSFVSFFPHLVAGPILYVNELIPQFRALNCRVDFRNIAIGLTIFSFGLFKKVVLADSISNYSTPIFTASNQGTQIGFILAWQAAIAYTLQLYFDFSGYSDMAIGLAKIVNIKLPINFFSPYKATSIGGFWRSWHISLGRFLRDYIYIPLGGSRRGEFRRYLNLLVTMSLGGLWHGANWTFIFWGVLHGFYLCIDHGWGFFVKKKDLTLDSVFYNFMAHKLTLLSVIISWVIFRAESFPSATNILSGMIGIHGFTIPVELINQLGILKKLGVEFEIVKGYAGITGSLALIGLLLCTLHLPNIYQFMIREPVALDVYSHLSHGKSPWYAWRPTLPFLIITFFVFIISLFFCSKPSEFLYFQF